MTTATGCMAADLIAAGSRSTLGYAELLVKDIPAEKFAFMPMPNVNHPAFAIGHLSIYGDNILKLIGRTELVRERPEFVALFKAGVACVADDGRYPGKDEIVDYFLERYRAAAEALKWVSEDVLNAENPAEGRWKLMFPKVGGAVNFLLNNHAMMHLGQVSAWRRVMGMPGVM